MNALQAHGIKETSRVSDDHAAVEVVLRLRPVAAFGYSLRAVGMQASSFQKVANKGMRLELMKPRVRVDAGIEVFESDHEPDGCFAVRQVVEEPALESF